MRKKISMIVLAAIFVAATAKAQNTFPATGSTGIGTTTPNASALLEVQSTTQGLLIPRMSKTQRDLIDAFLDEARARNCVMTKWQVLEWNDPAIKFYQKNKAIIETDWWNGKLFL